MVCGCTGFASCVEVPGQLLATVEKCFLVAAVDAYPQIAIDNLDAIR